MNKYDEMSAHELSSAILLRKVLALGYKANIRPSIQHEGGSSNAYCGNTLENFDINNPADMWLIIVDNNISITHHPSGDAMTFIQGGGFSKFKHESKNALRSAAITFLMMKDMTE